MSRLNVHIDGRVQGVGFRYFIVRRAQEQGLKGWVKNLADGGVSIEAVGPKGDLEDFLSYVRVGPPGARLGAVQAHWAEDEPVYKTFDVRF